MDPLCFELGDIYLNFTANPECPENEHYEKCGSACPATCSNYGRPGPACAQRCVEGCFCDKGYILDGQKCVKPKDCRKYTLEID